MEGIVFNIQRFCVDDGPGIRITVFLKGCPLRCRWCHNPESHCPEPQPFGDEICGKRMTVAQVMDEVKKDAVFYANSGGGLTLSGGECLSQPEFAIALLQAAKDVGLNTAIESTGFASYDDVIAKVLPNLDTYLMDIKHMNSEKHKAFIGHPNDLVLENARKIAANAKRLIIRVPTVPGFNDSADEIDAIARFAASLPNVEELHLLPYHRLGQDKYTWLGREYTLTDILPPTDEHMQMLLRVAEQSGLRCQIGG